MKTFYTLLLAFGLCFTVHAQKTYDFNSYFKEGTLDIHSITTTKYLDSDFVYSSLSSLQQELDVAGRKVIIITCKDLNLLNPKFNNDQNLQEIIFIVYKTNNFINNFLNFNYNNINVRIVLRDIPD